MGGGSRLGLGSVFSPNCVETRFIASLKIWNGGKFPADLADEGADFAEVEFVHRKK